METVRLAASAHFGAPVADRQLFLRITVFHASERRFDVQNVVKPICDALIGVAYDDDGQIMDNLARRREIGSGVFEIPNADLTLVTALDARHECVFIEVFALDDAEVLDL